MEAFTLRLANIPVGVSCQYDSTKEYCRDYLTEEPPAFSVSVSLSDCEAEQRFFEQRHSLPFLERLALYRRICEGLVAYDVFLLHGSAIAVDGEVYIFIALSGTGKSTHTAYWRELLIPRGHEVVMVNDDKPLIAVSTAGVFACGSPWNGAHRLGTAVELPVKAICVLERARENHIEEISANEAFPTLLQQTYRPSDPLLLTGILGMLGKVKTAVRFYRLGCTLSADAAETAYQAMK